MAPDLNQFGTIQYKRSLRASRISVRIQPDGLLVTLPLSTSKSAANSFIISMQERIKQKQQRLKVRHQGNKLTEEEPYTTLSFKVRIEKKERNTVFFNLENSVLRIELPLDVDIEQQEAQEVCWKGIYYFMKKEARRLLPGRVDQLAIRHGFRYKDVKIQSGKTRWGSCSSNQNINLSFYLMLLPPELVDYVILHELCHTREMNHGDKFWKLMDDVTDGRTDQYRKALKRYHIPQ
jgi:predicted metal-dependent hydrolase